MSVNCSINSIGSINSIVVRGLFIWVGVALGTAYECSLSLQNCEHSLHMQTI